MHSEKRGDIRLSKLFVRLDIKIIIIIPLVGQMIPAVFLLCMCRGQKIDLSFLLKETMWRPSRFDHFIISPSDRQTDGYPGGGPCFLLLVITFGVCALLEHELLIASHTFFHRESFRMPLWKATLAEKSKKTTHVTSLSICSSRAGLSFHFIFSPQNILHIKPASFCILLWVWSPSLFFSFYEKKEDDEWTWWPWRWW